MHYQKTPLNVQGIELGLYQKALWNNRLIISQGVPKIRKHLHFDV